MRSLLAVLSALAGLAIYAHAALHTPRFDPDQARRAALITAMATGRAGPDPAPPAMAPETAPHAATMAADPVR